MCIFILYKVGSYCYTIDTIDLPDISDMPWQRMQYTYHGKESSLLVFMRYVSQKFPLKKGVSIWYTHVYIFVSLCVGRLLGYNYQPGNYTQLCPYIPVNVIMHGGHHW